MLRIFTHTLGVPIQGKDYCDLVRNCKTDFNEIYYENEYLQFDKCATQRGTSKNSILL